MLSKYIITNAITVYLYSQRKKKIVRLKLREENKLK